MMDFQIIYLVLIVLIVATALNFKLTLSLLKVVNSPPVDINQSAPVPIGDELPSVMAKRLLSGTKVEVNNDGMPAVLLFLSSKCPTCQGKIPQLESIYPKVEPAGVRMHMVSQESKKRMRYFLSESPLLQEVLLVNRKSYKKLNPALASPFYLFVDHEKKLQAYGTIGDDDWQSFIDQLNDIEVVEERA